MTTPTDAEWRAALSDLAAKDAEIHDLVAECERRREEARDSLYKMRWLQLQLEKCLHPSLGTPDREIVRKAQDICREMKKAVWPDAK